MAQAVRRARFVADRAEWLQEKILMATRCSAVVKGVWAADPDVVQHVAARVSPK